MTAESAKRQVERDMDALKASLYAQLESEKKLRESENGRVTVLQQELQEAISREKQMRAEYDQMKITGKEAWDKDRLCLKEELAKAQTDIDTLRKECDQLRELRSIEAERAKSDMCLETDRLRTEAEAARAAFDRERSDLENVVSALENKIAMFEQQIGVLEGSIKALDDEEKREKEAHLREKGEFLRVLEACKEAMDAEKKVCMRVRMYVYMETGIYACRNVCVHMQTFLFSYSSRYICICKLVCMHARGC